jgi:hypothetical protein
MLSSRERVTLTLEHREPDRVPLDLGGSYATGMHVDSLYLLRQTLHLDPPGTPVRVGDCCQMLGAIDPDLQDAVGADVVRLASPVTAFGFRNEGWKPWTTFAGTPVLVPNAFNTDPEPNGDILQYPKGDKSAPPCAHMPRGGYYFDAITRQEPIDNGRLDVADNLEEYGLYSEADLAHLGREAARIASTGRAVMCIFGGLSLGDAGAVSGMSLAHPKGIRNLEEFIVSHHTRRDYIYEMFDRQCEIGLLNLKRVYEVAGANVTIAYITAADFGAQQGPFISPRSYRELYQPFHARINAWVHMYTPWKTFMHSCGSIWRLLDDIVDAGFDIINPVQTSAAGMEPAALKRTYGDRLTFWGGGIDTQQVLPFGTPDQVREMAHDRIRTFGPGGGYVFATIHNVQAGIPVENLQALYKAVEDYRDYPLQ